MDTLIAVLTGDVINSREEKASLWMPKLKGILAYYGKVDEDWEVYRGDSFQLMLTAADAVMAALHIKATIKEFKNLDVRIAIGVGTITHKAENITESNGSAFIASGEGFENLKKQTLSINAESLDQIPALTVMIDLAMLIANSWTVTMARLVRQYIEHPEKQQKEIASALNKSTSTVSESLSRSGFEEIKAIDTYYKTILSSL